MLSELLHSPAGGKQDLIIRYHMMRRIIGNAANVQAWRRAHIPICEASSLSSFPRRLHDTIFSDDNQALYRFPTSTAIPFLLTWPTTRACRQARVGGRAAFCLVLPLVLRLTQHLPWSSDHLRLHTVVLHPGQVLPLNGLRSWRGQFGNRRNWEQEKRLKTATNPRRSSARCVGSPPIEASFAEFSPTPHKNLRDNSAK